jgi:DNA-binding beta-propeller fold protein YncE
MRLLRSVSTALVLCACSIPAAADILVGNYGSGTSHELLRAFADDANGDVAPLRSLGGATSSLTSPVGGTFEPIEGVIYVADFWGQAVRVYPAWAEGDVAPLRVLDSPRVGQPRSVVVDGVHDELITTNSGCCVAEYARASSGDVPPLRWLQWGGLPGSVTQMNYPSSLAYLPATDEVAAADSDIASPFLPKVLIFGRADEGNSAPRRVIQGDQTGLGAWVGGLAWDAASQVLFAATYVQNADSSHSGRIVVFDASADGNVAPLRTIEGALTGLDASGTGYPVGLAIDPLHHHLIVGIQDQQALGNKLLVFDLDAVGNVAPLQVIGGVQTGMESIGTPIWVPADKIMHDGFD